MLMESSSSHKKIRSFKDIGMKLSQVNSMSEAFEDGDSGNLSTGTIVLICVLGLVVCCLAIWITFCCVLGCSVFQDAERLKELQKKDLERQLNQNSQKETENKENMGEKDMEAAPMMDPPADMME